MNKCFLLYTHACISELMQAVPVGEQKKELKKKERRNRSYMKQTGGGPPPEPLEDWEEEVHIY